MVPWAYFEHECIGPYQRLRIEKLQRFANYSEDLSPEAEVGPSVDFGEFCSGSITMGRPLARLHGSVMEQPTKGAGDV